MSTDCHEQTQAFHQSELVAHELSSAIFPSLYPGTRWQGLSSSTIAYIQVSLYYNFPAAFSDPDSAYSVCYMLVHGPYDKITPVHRNREHIIADRAPKIFAEQLSIPFFYAVLHKSQVENSSSPLDLARKMNLLSSAMWTTLGQPNLFVYCVDSCFCLVLPPQGSLYSLISSKINFAPLIVKI